MKILKMNNYNSFFNDDPWSGLNNACYPDGRRLYLNDERFWVSVDSFGRIMFFIHEEARTTLSILENLNSLEIKVDSNFIGSTRLCCTLIDYDKDLKNKFSIVAKDVAFQCSKYSGENLLHKVLLRIKSWADFLKPTRVGLLNSEYIGFWGELYTISQYLLKCYSPGEAVRFWVGPEGKKQDITLNSTAIEIKTSMSGDPRSIKINSLDQLERVTSSLFILHLIASPSQSGNGFSLKNLYEECLQKIRADTEVETLFLNKVFQLYGKASNEQLNNHISIINEKIFNVAEGFPVLNRKNIPLSICKVSYEILLSEITDFESERTIMDIIKNG